MIKMSTSTHVLDSSVVKKIQEGFAINCITMSDGDTGEKIWYTDDCQNFLNASKELKAYIPSKILKCRSVAREVNFSSKEAIKKLRLEQSIIFDDVETEFFEFKFGFVIPGSTNTWQQTIDADEPEKMMAAEILSGHLVVLTKFYDGDNFLCSSSIRIFYI